MLTVSDSFNDELDLVSSLSKERSAAVAFSNDETFNFATGPPKVVSRLITTEELLSSDEAFLSSEDRRLVRLVEVLFSCAFNSAVMVSRVTFFDVSFNEELSPRPRSRMAQFVTLLVALASREGRVWRREEALSVTLENGASRFSIVLFARSVVLALFKVALVASRAFFAVWLDAALDDNWTKDNLDANLSASLLELKRWPCFR